MVETNCADAAREVEFSEWYDKIHLPDVLETPGFIKVTRYENTEPSERKDKFLAIYEVEADDLDKVMKVFNDDMDRRRAEGRFSELVGGVSRGVYRQISYLSGSYRYLLPSVTEVRKEKGMEPILIIAGGIIPPEGFAFLKEHGVSEIFIPGTLIQQVADYINRNIKKSG